MSVSYISVLFWVSTLMFPVSVLSVICMLLRIFKSLLNSSQVAVHILKTLIVIRAPHGHYIFHVTAFQIQSLIFQFHTLNLPLCKLNALLWHLRESRVVMHQINPGKTDTQTSITAFRRFVKWMSKVYSLWREEQLLWQTYDSEQHQIHSPNSELMLENSSLTFTVYWTGYLLHCTHFGASWLHSLHVVHCEWVQCNVLLQMIGFSTTVLVHSDCNHCV